MNILILNNIPTETGIGRYVNDLYNSLRNCKYIYVKVLNFPNYNDYKKRIFVGDIVKPRYKTMTMNVLFRNIIDRRVMKMIYDYNGVVHYTASTMPVYKSKATKIGTVHDFYPFENKFEYTLFYSKYIERNLKYLLNLDNVIVTTNVYKTKLLEEYKYNGRVFVVPYAISNSFIQIENKAALRKELNLPTDKILILSVSDSSPHKNINILPSVMKILGDKFSLVRVGVKVGESITFSHANNTLINKIYNACDVLVFPSLVEGFGFPMIEAFATGLPVVASDISVFHEIGGVAPIYVNNKDPDSIANGIREALNNKEKMSKNGLEMRKLYSIDILGARMRKVYENII